MRGSRWERLQLLFHEAAALAPLQRSAFLHDACADDATLAQEVLALVQADGSATTLLDQGLARVAADVLGGDAALPAQRFGPYRIERLIGEGGMGAVYLAEREDLGSRVAIKVLRDAGLSPARRALFAAEQRTLAQLAHPSITRLYDADVTADGVPFIVMEFIEGEPLTRWCAQRRCTLTERLQLFRAVCEAVQYAHQHAVIHRDLKPSNVLVRSDGRVSLLDFGIAKHLEADGGAAQTRTTLHLMTPLYAAPEQIAGGAAGVQTDVYALGVILYQLLTSRLPFGEDAAQSVQLERRLAGAQPERPSLLVRRCGAADIPDVAGTGRGAWADLDVLCLAGMHPDPRLRYPSVEGLIRDLDHYLRGEPLEARPDSLAYRTGKFITRHRVSVGTATVAACALLGSVTFFTVRLHGARDAALQQAERAERIQSFMTTLLQGGDVGAGPAEGLRVLTLLDRGAMQARGLGTEPAVQADLFETLGKLYQTLGKLDQADTLLGEALDLRRRLFGPHSAEVARTLSLLALLRSDQGHLPEAEALAGQGLTMLQTHAGPADPALAPALAALGRVQAQRGAYTPALATLARAVDIDSRSGTSSAELAASLGALADAHYSAGHYDAARGLYQRLLALDRQLHGPNHPAIAEDLSSLAAIEQDLGYYRESEALARQALDITRAYYGADHPRTAGALTLLGRALLYQKQFAPAQSDLEQALAIERHTFGPVHTSVADALNELGNAASLGGDYAQALARFQEVADIYRTIYGDHHYLVAIALSNVAYVHLNRGHYSQAEQLFRDVVRRFGETLGADNVNTGIARIKLGRTLLREARYADARDQTLTGYEILGTQTNPGVSFLQAARTDLAAEYEALQQPQLAQQYRAELAAARRPAR